MSVASFLIISALSTFGFVSAVNGQAVKLSWDANPQPDIAGYRVYCGTTSRVYTQCLEVGNSTSLIVSGLQAGKHYYFAATDYDVAGMESDESNEVSYLVPLAGGTPTPTPKLSPSPTPTPKLSPSPTPTPKPSPTLTPAPSATASPASSILISAVSRKVHGSAGVFDITLLPLTATSSVECRSGGVSGIYQIVATFSGTVSVNTASVTSGSGSVKTISASGRRLIATLGNVPNGQTTIVTFSGVRILPNPTSYTLAIPLSVVIGDTTGDRRVTSLDVSQTTAGSGTVVTSANFRTDVNADGTINTTDVGLVQSNLGLVLH